MIKVDQSQSLFDKLIPSFLHFSNPKVLIVTDIAENRHTNTLFVAIEDYT
mgnify:CR=1 FL=1